MGTNLNRRGMFQCVLTCIVAALYGVAIGTPYWRKSTENPNQTYGLFENCTTNNGSRACTTIGWDPVIAGIPLTVARGLVLGSGIFIVIGIFTGFSAQCGSRGNIKVQGACNIVAALVLMGGCTNYIGTLLLGADETSDRPIPTEFGYSYYFCWAVAFSLMFSGIWCCEAKRNEVDPS